MATEFLRLYRELTKQEVDTCVPDVLFNKERRSLLRSLGHNVGGSTVTVQTSKHHGKTARLRMDDARQKAVSGKSAEEVKLRREMKESLRRTNEAYELNMELQTLILGKKPIPKKLWNKLFGDEGSSSSGLDLESKRLNAKESIRTTTIPRPKAGGATLVDTDGALRVGAGATDLVKSKNHWDRDEVQRLNTIYWEIALPPNLQQMNDNANRQQRITDRRALQKSKSAGKLTGNPDESEKSEMAPSHSKRLDKMRAHAEQAAWDNYYHSFAIRHQLFYPHRREADIIEKVQECIHTRRFKERGESDYWATMSGDRCFDNECTPGILPPIHGKR
jgi:hypothetical protein